MSDLKKRVKELADIATALPENLQVTCFELLLTHHLGLTGATAPPPPIPPSSESRTGDMANGGGGSESAEQEDLAETDLHAKARHFMQQHTVSLDHLRNLFYKEDGQIRPLYEDLKTTRMAEGQVRIAMLQALANALTTGTFEASVEAIRAEAQDRKSYDGPNFTKAFKNNSGLFDFDVWDKSMTSVRLSPEGKKALAGLIKDLQ